MRIAVCDDNELDRAIITSLLERYFEGKSISYRIETYASGVNLLHEVKDGRRYDVVFLDIYMDTKLGIDVARELRQIPYNGAIVFLTATAEFAVDSYDVDAIGYLLKPHSYEKLCGVMKKVTTNYDVATYQITFRNNVIRIPYHEILYFESDNVKCLLHHRNGKTYSIRKKMNEIEEEVSKDPRWLRCHLSYLVNMEHIQHADSRFTLFNGEEVMIRQRTLKEIRAKYLLYAEKKQKYEHGTIEGDNINDIKRVL